MKLSRIPVAIVLLAAVLPAHARKEPEQPAAPCEENFNVDGSWGSGRMFTTTAEVPDVDYLPAFHKIRDKIAADGLEIIAAQEKNGYIRASNRVRGEIDSTANVPLRVYVHRLGARGVRVEMQYTIAGGHMTRKKYIMGKMCDVIAAASQ